MTRAADIKKAIEYYDRAIKIDSENALALYNLGLAYSVMGEYGKATTQLRKAKKFSPDDADIPYAIGLTFAARKNYRNAIRNYEEALKIDPQHTYAVEALAIAKKNDK